MVVLAFGRVALLLVGVGLAYFAYLVTQVYLRWSVLQKMPHNGASRSTIGAKGPVRAKGSTFERLPLIMAKEADRLGTGIYSFRLLHKIGVVVTDPILISQGLLLPKVSGREGGERGTGIRSFTFPWLPALRASLHKLDCIYQFKFLCCRRKRCTPLSIRYVQKVFIHLLSPCLPALTSLLLLSCAAHESRWPPPQPPGALHPRRVLEGSPQGRGPRLQSP